MKKSKEMRVENDRLAAAFEDGRSRGLWTTQQECADILKMNRTTLRDQLIGRTHGARVQETTAAIRGLLSQPETASSSGLPPPGGSNDATKLLQLLGKFLPQSTSNPPEGLVASPWFELLFSGVATFRDQQEDGVPFILTADNFRRLKGEVSPAWFADTVRLIRVLRQRITLLLQHVDPDVRGDAMSQMAEELDELFLLLERLGEVEPLGAAQELQSRRQRFTALRGTKK